VTVLASVYSNQFTVLGQLWALKAGDRYWHSNDFNGEFTAQGGLRRQTSFYTAPAGRAIWRQADRALMLARRCAGDKFLGYGFHRPPFGGCDIVTHPGLIGMGLGGNASVLSPEPAFGYSVGNPETVFDTQDYTVASSRVSHTITFCRKAVGYVGKWKVTIPELAVSNMDIGCFAGHGVGVNAVADFFTERNGFRHNPTCAGDGLWLNPFFPGGDPASYPYNDRPSVTLSTIADTQRRLFAGVGVPLEWDFDGNRNLPPPPGTSGDHGGGVFNGVIWQNLLMGTSFELNSIMDEVHRFTYYSYYPFSINFADVNFYSATWGWWIPQQIFDRVYFYDAASQTLFDTGAAPPGTKNGWNWGTGTNWYQEQDDTHAVITNGPSKIPSGRGGMIYRKLASNLALGCYVVMVDELAPGVGPILNVNGVSRIGGGLVDANEAVSPPDQTFGSGFGASMNSLRRPAGWLKYSVFIIIDSFANVQTKMRQLYLAGVDSGFTYGVAPDWFPYP